MARPHRWKPPRSASARTDRRGNLLLPALLSNYGNRVAVSEQDVPGDRAIPEGEQLIATPWRGGSLVRFSAARVLPVFGRVVVLREDSSLVVPAFGQLRIAGGTEESPVGRNGEFFVEHLTAGRHEAVLEYRAETCRFPIVVPVRGAAQIDLGQITCRETTVPE